MGNPQEAATLPISSHLEVLQGDEWAPHFQLQGLHFRAAGEDIGVQILLPLRSGGMALRNKNRRTSYLPTSSLPWLNPDSGSWLGDFDLAGQEWETREGLGLNQRDSDHLANLNILRCEATFCFTFPDPGQGPSPCKSREPGTCSLPSAFAQPPTASPASRG